jgi:glycosyl transferase family 87
MIGVKVAIHENDARGHAPRIMGRTGFGAILIAGLALRGAVIAFTAGTSDLWLWDSFAKALNQYGLAAYAHVERLNHPPLGAFLVWALYKLGPLGITLRAFQALADVAAAMSIYKIAQHLNVAPRFAAGLYFLSPVAILTSCFFCNTDSTLVALIVAAVLMLITRRYALAGALLACACGIKIVPVLAFPLFFIAAREGRLRFTAAFVILSSVIFLPVLAYAPLSFIHNVLGYRGSGEMWGLALPATVGGAAATVLGFTRLRTLLYHLGDVYIAITRYCVLAIVALVTWIGRNVDEIRFPAALTLLLLGAITVAPRATLGYFLWFLPFLPFTFKRSLTLTIQTVASLQLIADYRLFSLGTRPWLVNLGRTDPWWLGRAIDVIGIPLWCLCIWSLTTGIITMRRSELSYR